MRERGRKIRSWTLCIPSAQGCGNKRQKKYRKGRSVGEAQKQRNGRGGLVRERICRIAGGRKGPPKHKEVRGNEVEANSSKRRRGNHGQGRKKQNHTREKDEAREYVDLKWNKGKRRSPGTGKHDTTRLGKPSS